MHKGELLYHTNGYDIIQCDECKFKHILPIPSDAELHKMYAQRYHADEKPNYFTRMVDDLDWWNSIYDVRLRMFNNMVHWTRRRLLDIGSGPGYFLKRARMHGWMAVGVEPSRKAVLYSRDMGLNIREGFFDGNFSVLFDVVHMYEVLEHLPDPRRTLELAWGSLNPGGIICITVPNDFNPLQGMVGTNHYMVPPWHINYFDAESLGNLMFESGFAVTDYLGSFPMEFFLLMGLDYRDNDVLGRQLHKNRIQFEENMDDDFRQDLYRTFAEKNIGREITVIGRRQ